MEYQLVFWPKLKTRPKPPSKQYIKAVKLLTTMAFMHTLITQFYQKSIQLTLFYSAFGNDCPRCGGKGTPWGCKICGKKTPTY